MDMWIFASKTKEHAMTMEQNVENYRKFQLEILQSDDMASVLGWSVARAKEKKKHSLAPGVVKSWTLRILGPSDRGDWICIAGFRDLQPLVLRSHDS